MQQTAPTARLFVAVPVFNGERFLEEALECLRTQTYRDIRVVVFDNASTDATEAIARAYVERDPRFGYVRRETNIGAGPNFNAAFEACDAPLFKWHAHDDVLAPTFLERCVEALDASNDAVLAHAWVREISETGAALSEQPPISELATSPDTLTRFRANVMSRDMCTEVFGVFRSSALQGSILHRPFPGSDRTLLAEVSLRGRLVIVPEVLFYNREHPNRFMRTVFATLEQANDARRLVQWYDPSAPRNRGRLYRWTFFLYFFRIINRNVAGPFRRVRYYLTALGWLTSRYNRHDLARDILTRLGPGAFGRLKRMKAAVMAPFRRPRQG